MSVYIAKNVYFDTKEVIKINRVFRFRLTQNYEIWQLVFTGSTNQEKNLKTIHIKK